MDNIAVDSGTQPLIRVLFFINQRRVIDIGARFVHDFKVAAL